MSLINIFILHYLTWLGCFIFYPSWLVSDAFPVSRAAVFILLFCYLTGLYLLSFRLGQKITYEEKACHTNRAEVLKYPLIISVIFLTLQIIPIFYYPVAAWNDEGWHAASPLLLLDKVDIMTGLSVALLARIVSWAVILFSLCHIYKRGCPGFFSGHKKGHMLSCYAILFIFISALAEFLFFKDIPYFSSLFRFPPASKILYTLSVILFGYSVVPMRGIQMVFVLASFYIFNEILYMLKVGSVLRAIFVLLFALSPWAMTFAHSAQLSGGVIFFQLCIVYCFLLYIDKWEPKYLFYTSFWIGTGFLYKRPICLFTGIIAAALSAFIIFREKNSINIRDVIIFLLLCAAPVIPWLILGKYLTYRNYSPVLSNLADFDKVTIYLSLMGRHFSYPLLFFSGISALWILFYRREFKHTFLLLWFFSYYLLFTCDSWAGKMAGRGTLFLFIPVLLLSSIFIQKVTEQRKRLLVPFTVVLIAITALQLKRSIWLVYRTTDNPEEPDYYINKEVYLPYDRAFAYLNKTVAPMGENILIIDDIGEATFYIRKYGLQKINTIFRLPRGYGFTELVSYCTKNKIDYFLLPYNLDISNNPLLLNRVRTDDRLVSSSYFDPINTLSFRNNKIDLFKLTF